MNNVKTCKCLIAIEGNQIGDVVPFQIMYGTRYSFLIKNGDPSIEDHWDGWSCDNNTFLKHFELIYENDDLSYLIPFLKENNIV